MSDTNLFWSSGKCNLSCIYRKHNDSAGLKELAVVTGIKRPPNPVHVYSQKQGIEVNKWPTGNETGRFDIGVVVSFSHLIPERIINSFPL